MGGLFLTDDLLDTTQWSFPEMTLDAGEFLLVWCDNDEGDGPLHTNFKLGGSGEEIGLFGRLAAGNLVIDSYAFGEQTTDVSEGRETDGGEPWIFFETPTPGASNEGGCAGDLSGDAVVNVTDLLMLLGAWGTDGSGADLAEPLDVVNVSDLLVLLGAWGACD